MGQGTSPRLAVSLAALVVGGGLAACQGGAAGGRDLFSGNPDPGRPYQSPSAVSGGTRGGGRPAAPDPAAVKVEEDALAAKARAEAEAAKAAQAREADALWNRAEARRDPEDAADDYRKLATDHKDSPRAEEARWRAAVKYFEAGEWSQCLAALDIYTKDFPVNPHLADAERMTYDAALRHYDEAHTGLSRIFKSDQASFDALASIVDRFPQGQYPDDALLTLGELYRRKEDYAVAALQYRNLLIRYPDSEWSFQARLRLGDVYLARDQGAPYHAGYVDLDPREPTNPAASASRPVRSCVEAALVEYETFLERIAADPARRAEYASDVSYAQERVAECRRRLAEKDRAIAGFYGARGQGTAANAYERFAGNVEGGKAWSDGLSSPPAPRTTPPAATP
ncbi:MAG: outer membrane protein assembly factor BamD, partial [Planctomycetia bacterium]|nr:outer membrane protein assembly factor BamD [Planctomycetia bacterium]